MLNLIVTAVIVAAITIRVDEVMLSRPPGEIPVKSLMWVVSTVKRMLGPGLFSSRERRQSREKSFLTVYLSSILEGV